MYVLIFFLKSRLILKCHLGYHGNLPIFELINKINVTIINLWKRKLMVRFKNRKKLDPTLQYIQIFFLYFPIYILMLFCFFHLCLSIYLSFFLSPVREKNIDRCYEFHFPNPLSTLLPFHFSSSLSYSLTLSHIKIFFLSFFSRRKKKVYPKWDFYFYSSFFRTISFFHYNNTYSFLRCSKLFINARKFGNRENIFEKRKLQNDVFNLWPIKQNFFFFKTGIGIENDTYFLEMNLFQVIL